jgi:hypothetical protein
MNELIEKITKLISGLHDTQANHTSEILKSRYEMLELLTILKQKHLIDGEHISRVYKKGEEYEQSSNES